MNLQKVNGLRSASEQKTQERIILWKIVHTLFLNVDLRTEKSTASGDSTVA